MTLHEQASAWFRQLQLTICDALEREDGQARFLEDAWERPGGGGGLSRVMEGGALFEKAGVNWSLVHGEMEPAFAAQMPGEGHQFYASGVSLVLHPRTPMVPTVHANFRVIAKGEALWFGGGADLTPYYPWEEDAVHFHQTLKDACDKHEPAWYPRFKQWCDDYFTLPHRQEQRGIGGVFYDYVGLRADQLPKHARHTSPLALEEPVAPERAFAFAQSVGGAFLDAYLPIVHRRREEPWGEAEREFQLHRRGRYVEFNLVYDRGTLFGLKTNGRTESILMSLPPVVRWSYDWKPAPGSREAKLLEFIKPRDWLGLGLDGA